MKRKLLNKKSNKKSKIESKKRKICPNCGHELKFLLKEWVCVECEYHSSSCKKIEKGSFR
ncbi:MAG: hypothetical protein QW480_00620 [Candidatus Aenigmatarchaeota archaeon]